MRVALTAALAGVVWLWWPLQVMVSGTHATVAAASVAIGVAQPRRPDAGRVEPLLSLARRAPEEAWLRAAAMEESTVRGSRLRLIAALWLELDPNGAMSAFEAVDEELVPTSWMFEMLARWLVADEEAAADWALSATGGRRPMLITGVIDWLLKRVKHGCPRTSVLALADRTFRRWAQEEPADAWEAAAMSHLARKRDLVRGVAEVWFEVDQRAALDAAVSDNLWQYGWVQTSLRNGPRRPLARPRNGRWR